VPAAPATATLRLQATPEVPQRLQLVPEQQQVASCI
jgi:hypothetical protein